MKRKNMFTQTTSWTVIGAVLAANAAADAKVVKQTQDIAKGASFVAGALSSAATNGPMLTQNLVTGVKYEAPAKQIRPTVTWPRSS